MKHFTSSIGFSCFVLLSILRIDYVTGQATGDAKEDFLYGEYYLTQGMYLEAIPFFVSSLKDNPDNSNINYRIGLCYSKIIGEQHKALPYLKKAVLDIDKNYIDGRFKSTAAPIESWMLLGDAYHRINELTNASHAYNKYLELLGDSDDQKKAMVKKKISGLGISYEFQRKENKIVLMNLGAGINSRFSDYNPVVSGDQNTMVYTQYWETFDRIMITHKTDNAWSVPIEINDQIGSAGDCYTSALSFKGDELFLIKYSNENYDIYSSKLVDGKWSKLSPLPGKINTKHQESSICISADGNFIYFSSNRTGGEGGFDIYMAEKTGNSWGNIKNMGNVINTKRNEEGPYISYDGTVLYFSSDGHETIGNMDILYAEIDEGGNWQAPVNIGYPINTTSDDLFYIYFKNTKTGYLSRDLTEGIGKNDIYAIVNENGMDISLGAFQINNIVESKLSTRDDYLHTYPVKSDSSLLQPRGSILGIDSLSKKKNDSTNLNAEYQNEVLVASSIIIPVAPVSGEPLVSDNIENNPVQTTSVETSGASSINENISIPGEPDKSDDVVIITPNTVTSGFTSETQVPVNTGSETTGAYAVGVTATETTSGSDISVSNIAPVVESSQINPQEELFQQEYNYQPIDPDSIPTYTIQLLALKRKKKLSAIKIAPIIVSAGEDGLYRYTTGEYQGWSVALSHLEEIKASGFPDAFIRNIDSISNYSISKK